MRNASSPKANVTNRGKKRQRNLEGGIGTRNTNTQTKKKTNKFMPYHQTLKVLNGLFNIS